MGKTELQAWKRWNSADTSVVLSVLWMYLLVFNGSTCGSSTHKVSRQNFCYSIFSRSYSQDQLWIVFFFFCHCMFLKKLLGYLGQITALLYQEKKSVEKPGRWSPLCRIDVKSDPVDVYLCQCFSRRSLWCLSINTNPPPKKGWKIYESWKNQEVVLVFV